MRSTDKEEVKRLQVLGPAAGAALAHAEDAHLVGQYAQEVRQLEEQVRSSASSLSGFSAKS